jgi:hypothetical protein
MVALRNLESLTTQVRDQLSARNASWTSWYLLLPIKPAPALFRELLRVPT